jgi:hypothetical protein
MAQSFLIRLPAGFGGRMEEKVAAQEAAKFGGILLQPRIAEMAVIVYRLHAEPRVGGMQHDAFARCLARVIAVPDRSVPQTDRSFRGDDRLRSLERLADLSRGVAFLLVRPRDDHRRPMLFGKLVGDPACGAHDLPCGKRLGEPAVVGMQP